MPLAAEQGGLSKWGGESEVEHASYPAYVILEMHRHALGENHILHFDRF